MLPPSLALVPPPLLSHVVPAFMAWDTLSSLPVQFIAFKMNPSNNTCITQ